MKKVIMSFILIACCLFCFTACDNLGKTYWKDTQVEASKIFTSEEFLNIYEISFNENIQKISAQSYGENYAELQEVYSPMFVSAISYSYFHYEDFLVVPKNDNDGFKKAIRNVNSNLSTLKNSLEDFNSKKTEYESWIDESSESFATSDTEKARLQLFKREYISLIQKAYNLSQSIFEARRVGYYDFSNYNNKDLVLVDANADCDLAISASNLQILNTAIKIMREYNAKDVANSYSSYWQNAKNYYNNIIIMHKNGELTPKEDAKESLKKWQNVYNLFKQENARFVTILDKLDLQLLTKCNNDAKKYAEETNNKNNEIYANYYLSFYNNIELLNIYSLNLFQ